MQLRWKIKEADEQKVTALADALKVSPVVCRLLVHRGIETYEDARKFFRPELSHLHNPFLMRDMDKAIARITEAIASNQKILVYGDYDVDGTTAVAAVYSFFKDFYPNIDYYVPNRYTEGYGISFQGIDYAAQNNFALIIALDCGIKANDKIDYANQCNIDFVICDHHTPGHEIPKAIAVLDPKRSGCTYPFKELSGCGIGFKLIQAYCLHHQLDLEKCYRYLDLVCVSIGADIVSLVDENRTLAYFGLQKLNTNPQPGLQKLMEVTGSKKIMDITSVVFFLAPRINAAGRMDDAKYAVKLLIAEEGTADTQASALQLHKYNTDRKDLDKNITESALEKIATDKNLQNKKSTVLYSVDWHKGVLGIVASRLTETYYRPTIVMCETDGKLTGSARSVKGFDLYEAIYECREHLIQFGGHKFAAGLTMLKENFNAFAEKFEQVVNERITPEQLIPELEIDTEIELKDIQPKFYNVIKQMEPFGPDNMKPIFVTRNVKDTGWSKIVKEEHIKFSVNQNGAAADGIGFKMAKKFDVVKNDSFDIAYHIDENEWNGNVRLQLMVKDVK